MTVPDRDGAGLVQQERRYVTGRLHRTARHRQHVALHEPVHAGDPDRRQETTDRGRDEAHEQRHQDDHVLTCIGVDGERLQAGDREEEDDREASQEDRQRDLVRRLLPVGAFDERDHPVEEGLARSGRDAHHDPVGKHLGAAGDSRAVPARLADDRRGLSRDGRLVDRCDAFDDITIRRDHLARVHDALVTDVEEARGHLLDATVGKSAVGDGLAAGLAQRRGLGLAAALRHRLGEVREEHCGPEEERHQEREDVLARRRLPEVADEEDRRVDAADLDHEHHRVAEHHPRVELAEAVLDRGPDDRSIEHAAPRAGEDGSETGPDEAGA